MDTIISYTTYIHTSQSIMLNSYARRIANSNNEERNISHTNRQILKYNLSMKKEKDISNRKHD